MVVESELESDDESEAEEAVEERMANSKHGASKESATTMWYSPETERRGEGEGRRGRERRGGGRGGGGRGEEVERR